MKQILYVKKATGALYWGHPVHSGVDKSRHFRQV